jgi:hypothetical protein
VFQKLKLEETLITKLRKIFNKLCKEIEIESKVMNKIIKKAQSEGSTALQFADKMREYMIQLYTLSEVLQDKLQSTKKNGNDLYK